MVAKPDYLKQKEHRIRKKHGLSVSRIAVPEEFAQLTQHLSPEERFLELGRCLRVPPSPPPESNVGESGAKYLAKLTRKFTEALRAA